MHPERLITALLLLAIGSALAYVAVRLFGTGANEPRPAIATLCAVGAVFMGWWAVNVLTPGWHWP